MKTIKIISTFALFLFTVISVFGQEKVKTTDHVLMTTVPKIQKAVCVMQPTKGNEVTGVITFTQTPEGVKVTADMQGLTKGKHGIHIHECGDCSSTDGTSAGGHFNPEKKSHGAPSDMMRHEGDLGNIEADETGKAHLEYTDTMIKFDGEYSIIGRSIIIHKSEDDFKTQPTGNAGARVACGVIGIGK